MALYKFYSYLILSYRLMIEEACFQSLYNNMEYRGVILINFMWCVYDVQKTWKTWRRQFRCCW